MMLAAGYDVLGACPPPGAPGPPASPIPAAPYTRYSDPTLQEVYARVFHIIRAPEIPIYGSVFSQSKADEVARNAIDAVRALPQSPEVLESIRCAAINAARENLGTLLLVGLTIAGIAAGTAYYVAKP